MVFLNKIYHKKAIFPVNGMANKNASFNHIPGISHEAAKIQSSKKLEIK